MKLLLAAGSTSVIAHVFMPDSTSTTGAGKTALAFGDFTVYYVRAGGTLTLLTTETIAALGTYAAPTSAAHIRIALLSDANAPGLYEVQFHNSQLAAGANQATFMFRAAGAAPTLVEIQLETLTAAIADLHLDLTVVDAVVDAIKAVTDLIDVGDVTVVSGVVGSRITVVPYTTWEFTISGLTNMADAAANGVLFTAKRNYSDADTDAIVQVREGVGLVRINGAAGVAGKATLVVAGSETALTVHVNASQTGQISPAMLVWDVKKVITTLEDADQVGSGEFEVAREAVTRELTV